MHLLATSSALLDEQSAAVDIAQPAADVLVASFSDSDLRMLGTAHAAVDTPWSLGLVNLRVLAHPMSVDLWLDRTARHARLIVVRLLGGLDWWRYGAESLAQRCRRHGIHLALLPGEDRDDPRLADLSTLPAAALTRLLALFRAGGAVNGDRLVTALGHLRDGDGAIPDAVAAPLVAPYAQAGDGSAGRVVLLLYRSQVLAGDTAPADMLIDRLAAAGVAVHAFHLPGLKGPEVAAALAAHKIGAVDLVLTLTAFGGGGDLPFGDAPLLHLVNATTLRDAWMASDRGLGASDLAMHVVLPEIDGRVLTGVLSFKQADDATAVALSQPEPALLDRAVERVLARLRLRHTPADRRRLVALLPDYPGAAGREAYAVGLDVPASLRAIMMMLADAGYQTGPLPPTDRALLDAIIAGDADACLTLEAYQVWLDAHPDAGARMRAAWGPPQEDPTFQNGCFRFRALACGPHWLALPPERGRADQRRADYHDVTLPPRHGLMAFCHWMQGQAPHALLHLGAHGTLEWLPGKAVALTPDCFPELAVGALPVIYPFILTNPGEAAQAKRRLAAVTPGHLPPPLTEGSLTGAMAALERLVEEYAQADGVDPRRRDRLGALILDEARAQGLLATLGLDPQDGGEALRRIDAWLCDLKDMALQDGLHVYGQAPADAGSEILASAAAERAGLLTALAGRHLPPGPAGAPARGRRDVLPSGRNLFTSDPRTLPTPTAFALARKAADAVIRLHLQEKGEMPRHLVLDLWGSAGLRTGGEEVAQVLAFLGCQPLWDPATGRVRGVQVLPPAVLDWPRVDVTCRLSGLFRDLFPTQIALLDSAIQAVAARDESDEDNPLAAAARAGDDLLRLFSCAPGRYGSGIDGALSDPSVADADLAGAYLEAAGFACTADGSMIPAPGVFTRQVERADLLVHGADDPHRDLLQGGADAAFIGGFALAARADAGLIVLDTSNPDSPRPRPLAAALARIVRGRATHPRHVRGLMRHGPRGGAEMAEAVDRLADFARATRGRGPDGGPLVDGALFDLMFDAYLADPDVADFLARENPDAGRAIAQRLDWVRREGLWPCRRNDLSPLSRWLDAEDAA